MKGTRIGWHIIVVVLLHCPVGELFAQQAPVFRHITQEDGLSSSSVLSLAQDSMGFVWAGTMDGLNRYDGQRIKVYKAFYKDNFIGPSIKISQLCTDGQGNVWIGTNNGLYVYNTGLDTFRVFYHTSADKHSLRHNEVKALYVDKQARVWAGTQQGINLFTHAGGFQFQSRSVQFTNQAAAGYDVRSLLQLSSGQMLAGTTQGLVLFEQEPGRDTYRWVSSGLNNEQVTTLAEDKSRNIWAGTQNRGIFRVGMDLQNSRQFIVNKNSSAGPVSNTIRKILADTNGQLWIGTLKGLNVLNPETLAFATYVHDADNVHSLNFNSIYDILQDRQGSIWIATYFGGLNMVEAVTTPFRVYNSSSSAGTLSSDIVGPMLSDAQGNLWIGTEAEGLNYLNRSTGQFRYYNNDETNPASLSSNLIKTLLRDQQNNIWVGLHSGGINVLNAAGKKIKSFDKTTLNSNDVISLMADGNNHIWAGTVEDGINIIDPVTNRVEKFETRYPVHRLASKAITCLYRDSRGNIWIGTRQGISKLQVRDNVLTNFVRTSAPGQLLSDYINCIAEDREGNLWFGTYAGLSHFDRARNTFSTYTTADGLSGNKVVGLVFDDHNKLWIATNNGLTVLDSTRKVWQRFTVEDGLPGNVFNYNSFYRDGNGRIFLGTYKGLVEFNPLDIQVNSEVPTLQFTGLSVHGKPVSRYDAGSLISTDISNTQAIELAYDQNVLKVDYAIMNFIKPGKNRSAYKLEGYHTDWQYTTDNAASFTGLEPGSYTLLVKGSNNDGVWNDTPISLQIKIQPPPWKTWWAYSLYAIVLASLAFVIIWFISSRTALRRKLRYEHMLNLKQQELHQMKMDFFTHISHEIRTPLTLIMGPVELLQMKHGSNPDDNRLLEIVKNNGDRLLKLTSDLIEFRKAETGHTALKLENRDMVAFAQLVFQRFEEQARRRDIAFGFESTETNCTLLFDAHQMEIVLSNLLSNALKFTPEGGKVWMELVKKGKKVTISVHDNGPGIPQESQEKIFTTFYQADNVKNKIPGSGIGLAFSKSLVELHGGTLSFSSTPNAPKGERETIFSVVLTQEEMM